MKTVNNMSNLFEKLDDLKVVFTYGQKIIPVLQSLIDFMRDTVPLLETVNSSIAQSTKAMPDASEKICDISNATELATTEILDLVDATNSNLDEMRTMIMELEENQANRSNAYNKLKNHLKDDSEGLEYLEQLNGFNSIQSKIDIVKETIEKIDGNLSNITLSLQVQDITSQQLNSVNHLISHVQNSLTHLLYDIGDGKVDNDLSALKIETKDESEFNGGASYTDKTSGQKMADELMKENISSSATQDEIDKLFS